MTCTGTGWGAALPLGLLQGIAEWLPVSSEGMAAAVYGLVCGGSLAEGVEYALWLHTGTMPAALVALRREAAAAVRDVLAAPARLPPVAAFLFLSAAISGVTGLPLLLLVAGRGGGIAGPAVMALIGAALLVTSAAQLLRSRGGERERHSAGRGDAVVAGLAQGVSVIPGFSRSGLTVSALLARGFRGRDTLVLSFLMSVPASSGVAFSPESLAGPAAAFLSGLLTVRILLRLAARMNYGRFLLAAGAVMLGGALWEVL